MVVTVGVIGCFGVFWAVQKFYAQEGIGNDWREESFLWGLLLVNRREQVDPVFTGIVVVYDMGLVVHS